jgi:hypothetical protein
VALSGIMCAVTDCGFAHSEPFVLSRTSTIVNTCLVVLQLVPHWLIHTNQNMSHPLVLPSQHTKNAWLYCNALPFSPCRIWWSLNAVFRLVIRFCSSRSSLSTIVTCGDTMQTFVSTSAEAHYSADMQRLSQLCDHCICTWASHRNDAPHHIPSLSYHTDPRLPRRRQALWWQPPPDPDR